MSIGILEPQYSNFTTFCTCRGALCMAYAEFSVNVLAEWRSFDSKADFEIGNKCYIS